jgi:hypothetical protein
VEGFGASEVGDAVDKGAAVGEDGEGDAGGVAEGNFDEVRGAADVAGGGEAGGEGDQT